MWRVEALNLSLRKDRPVPPSALSKQRPIAFVTGASAGIGEVYCRQLASAGYDLIVTARRVERLEALGLELADQFGAKTEAIPADLTNRGDVERLETRIAACDRLVVLVNNAGFGVSGAYPEQPIEQHQRMIDVHISAAVRLTHAALPGMTARGRGYIINVSSVAAFVPTGGGPGYSASKAYLNAFSTNLQDGLAGTGVRVQALCPGYTYTEFHSSGTYQGKERESLPTWVWMTAQEVVAYSLAKLDSGKVIVVPGWRYKLIVGLLTSSLGRLMMALRGLFLKKGTGI